MAAELKKKYGVETKLTPGDRGVFDVHVDGKIVYSKKNTGRFPNEDEVTSLIEGLN